MIEKGDNHPLSGVGLSVSHFKCFGQKGGGFVQFEPISIIIGRNNTGKSALIDIVKLCISEGKSYDERRHGWDNTSFKAVISQSLDEKSLRDVFPEGGSGGGVPGPSHWTFGKQFIGQTLTRSFEKDWITAYENGPDLRQIDPNKRQEYQNNLTRLASNPFLGLELLPLTAERDVKPEKQKDNREIGPDGDGTTNLIRAFINSDDLPREEIVPGLLDDLNKVYRGDSIFSHIASRENSQGVWEIFLREDTKGDIRLSESGSSLRSVFIILSMLRLVPITRDVNWDKVVFAIEEPENNLHPALLRRLLNFLAEQREKKGYTLLVTTHSPVAIDWSSGRADSQIIHVQHDGETATTRTVTGYLDSREILDDLDIRASDILQANGIIWVEGPSDRIYIRRWLELASGGRLKEGVHYAIMFYAGKLLSHFDVLPPEEENALISLLLINRNLAVVIDSDRHHGTANGKKPRMRLNRTKQRIKNEVESIDGFVWITEGREIENYTPIEVYARVVGRRPPNVNPYTQIAELSILRDFKEDKMKIANAVASATCQADLEGHLDVWPRLNELCSYVRSWNGIRDRG